MTANIVMLIDITPESFPNFKVTILEKQEMRSVFLECGVKVSIGHVAMKLCMYMPTLLMKKF